MPFVNEKNHAKVVGESQRVPVLDEELPASESAIVTWRFCACLCVVSLAGSARSEVLRENGGSGRPWANASASDWVYTRSNEGT